MCLSPLRDHGTQPSIHGTHQLVAVRLACACIVILHQLATKNAGTQDVAPRLTRGIRTGPVARDGFYDYEHAPRMYNLDAVKNKELKFGAAIVGIVGGGIGVSVFALYWQQLKARG